ncbi:hypothetical protein Tco_0288395, partial [Tanacetum coccineum]
RQQVAAASAAEAAEDAPIVDEGAPAVSAPVRGGRPCLARSTRRAEKGVGQYGL